MPQSDYARVIFRNRVSDNRWLKIEADQVASLIPDPEQHYLLPLTAWQQAVPDFTAFPRYPGLWIRGADPLEPLAEIVQLAPVIAVQFDTFTDGSGFSVASALIEEYGFSGELRACGAILPDQALYLLRCGFNSLVFNSDRDTDLALQLIRTGSDSYQGSVDQPRTPFARRMGR